LKITIEMNKKKQENYLRETIRDIYKTVFEISPDDSTAKKAGKKIALIMFLILMVCGTLVTILAISFAH